MSNSDVPAGQAGGLSNVSEATELPSRLRVHALAKLITTTSRQVLDILAELGEPAKGAQSSIDREVALRVIQALSPDGEHPPVPTGDAASAEITEILPATRHEQPVEPTGVEPGGVEPTAASARFGLGFTAQATSAAAEVRPEHGAGSGGGVEVRTAPSKGTEVEEPELEPESPFGALPLFAAPSPMFLPPEPVSRPTSPPAPEKAAGPSADEADDPSDTDESGETKRRRRRGRRGRGRGRGADEDTLDGLDFEDGEPTRSAEADDAGPAPADPTDSAEQAEPAEPAEAEPAAQSSTEDEDEDEDSDQGQDGGEDSAGGSSRRRRRRRRRKDSGDSAGDSAERGDSDDPPNTVTKVREPRSGKPEEDVNQGIQGVRGSTRLEAKRQRRRDGRDAGRRRAPVLSEAEFLARRESVERTMVVRQHGERSEIGVLEDGVLVEHFVTSSGGSSLVGNVYLGRVQNVLPSMEAAFVDIGRGRNAVLYAGEVDWDAAGLAGKARRIEQALSSGDSILVQVTKDPIGHKGARLTTQISLPGRFLVYVPSGGTHGISRKLPDTERRRLKDLLKEIVPDDAGVIIRTASEGVSQEALERDVRRLQAQWDVVRSKADSVKGSGKSKAPELLYEEPDLMIKVVRDQFNEDFAKLVVSGDDAWDTLHAYIGHVAPELLERLRRHVGTSDVFTEYRIDEQLMKALDRKVWLPSGGTLVIDRTEAMTVIDVNTGKFTGSGGNLEETVTRNNLEAAEEIVRQLRLRDIGGIIVVDFIDMVLESNRDLVLRRLTECLGRDRTRHQVAEVTSLGLVQMTRKRVGIGLLEAFSTPCEHCRGRGVVVSTDPVEPRTDSGQHSSAGGGSTRRRGREHTEHPSGGGQSGGGQGGGGQGGHGGGGHGGGGSGSGGQRNGGHNGNGHNGGNGSGNGGRKGAGQDHSVAKQLADVAAANNGRPDAGVAPPAPAAADASPPAHREPAVAEQTNETPSDGPPTGPSVSVRPAFGTQPVSSATETEKSAGRSEPGSAARAGETRPEWTPTPTPDGQVAAEAPPGRDQDGTTAPDDRVSERGATEQPASPVAVGATSGRPTRRRRRSASRPAGPPSGG